VVGVATAAPRRSGESRSSCPRSPSETSTSASRAVSTGPGGWPGADTVLGPTPACALIGHPSPNLPPVGAFDDLATKRNVVVTTYNGRWIGDIHPSRRGRAQRPRLLPYLVNGRQGQTPHRELRVLIAPSTARS
jgi:hypothetical protein